MKPLSILLVILTNCFTLLAQQSGIAGKVIEVVGNEMPSPIAKKSTTKGAAKEILIYEITNQKQTTKENNFYKNVTTRLVLKRKTKTNGSFKFKLKPGRYSVFIREPDGLFANGIDGEGNINVVMVEAKKFTLLELRVDYEAAY